MNDTLVIEKLKIDTIIGVHQWERKIKQTVLVDLELEIERSNPANKDQIENTLDYTAVADKVSNIVEGSSYMLIESLAEALASKLIEEFSLIRIRLKLSKPSAIENAENVSIIMYRPI